MNFDFQTPLASPNASDFIMRGLVRTILVLLTILTGLIAAPLLTDNGTVLVISAPERLHSVIRNAKGEIVSCTKGAAVSKSTQSGFARRLYTQGAVMVLPAIFLATGSPGCELEILEAEPQSEDSGGRPERRESTRSASQGKLGE